MQPEHIIYNSNSSCASNGKSKARCEQYIQKTLRKIFYENVHLARTKLTMNTSGAYHLYFFTIPRDP
jgi:hypothetical protein